MPRRKPSKARLPNIFMEAGGLGPRLRVTASLANSGAGIANRRPEMSTAQLGFVCLE